MTTIYFLEAAVPLTKTFYALPDGSIDKDAYPLVANVTSHKEEVETIEDLHKAITKHALTGHCLLKGHLSRPLVNESRRGTTSTDGKSDWICLDFDRHECSDIDSELVRLGLGDVSYVLQFSSSHGMLGTEGTVSAHVFMLLDKEVPAPELKAWLMHLNLTHLRGDLELSRSRTVMRWPLDITTCQNDKLLYIANPIFKKPLKDPLKSRINIVKKKKGKLAVSRLEGSNINILKAEERKVLNELRKDEGLPARTARTTWQGAIEVQNKPDVCTVTGIKDTGEFVRLNLNGGDSWAYWHSKDNFELIHDFKSDTWYRTKELLPGYYQELVDERAALAATPTEDGDLILAFRDLKSAVYYNGLWNPEQSKLELYPARNETQLDHWMRSHGRFLGEFIPIWDIQYNPREDWIVDADNHRINMFVPTPYMYAEPSIAVHFPNIMGVINHMLGADPDNKQDQELVAHFLNWFTAIFQRVHKPLTAWVVHGVEGTGKGYFVNKIVMPLLGMKNTTSVTVSNIEDQFNGWIEGKLFVFVDEVDVDDFSEKGKVTAKLRNYITEPTISLRRMRQTAVDTPNYASFLFSSNRPRPVFIPESDRRYNVGNFQRNKLPRPNDEAVTAELEIFAQWLMAQQVDVTKANSVIHTEARDRIAKLSVTSIGETCNAILKGDFEFLWYAMPDEQLMNETGINNEHTRVAQAYCVLMRKLAKELVVGVPTPLSRDELILILQYNVGNMPHTPNKFTSLLRHNNIETKRVRRNGQITYGIEVEWQISDALREEINATLNPSNKLRKIK